jgi:ABC-type multidrug transport system ATPase subunit
MAKILEVDSVNLVFDNKRILSDVYLSFEEGKISGILGRNGVGKSYLLNLIFGSKTGDSRVRYDGKVMTKNQFCTGMIKYLPQFNIFPKRLKLKIILELFHLNPESLTSCFPEFENELNKPFGKFSMGHRRLIEASVFLLMKANFVLLDEPFSYLMPLHTEKLKLMMTEEKKNKGIIVTDHMYHHVLEISDSVYLIANQSAKLITRPFEQSMFGYLTQNQMKKWIDEQNRGSQQ